MAFDISIIQLPVCMGGIFSLPTGRNRSGNDPVYYRRRILCSMQIFITLYIHYSNTMHTTVSEIQLPQKGKIELKDYISSKISMNKEQSSLKKIIQIYYDS